jgi:hypothetical protein
MSKSIRSVLAGIYILYWSFLKGQLLLKMCIGQLLRLDTISTVLVPALNSLLQLPVHPDTKFLIVSRIVCQVVPVPVPVLLAVFCVENCASQLPQTVLVPVRV